jgi:LuxR family maltose regulon positive regulatory protein
VRLLQALAFQIQHYEERALSALSVAVHLAELQGYIRRFVDEGAPMAALLSKFREQQCKQMPTPYLDTLIAAFPKQSKGHKRQLKQQ